MAERISIEAVSKVYPGGNQALREVSLAVEPGTFMVLLGPSGSGKTTLLRSLAGIERVTSGRISIGGRMMADGRVHVPPDQRDLSMVFQDYALWPHLMARDNVAFALRRRKLPRAQAGERAAAMLDRVGLGALGQRYPNELSGGEQQRVALARALVADTGLILCDEPLSNLDADLRERMRLEISALVREAGATTVYITHDQAEAFALADRVGILEHGRLVQQGTPEEIYTQPATPFVARFTGLSGELPVQVRGTAADGTVGVELAGPAQARPFHARGPGLPLGEAAALLMIRPTGVQLVASDTGEHHVTGTVADVAFRGRGYEHAIDIPGHGRLTSVFSDTRAARGEHVGLRLDPRGCHLFSAGPAVQAPPAAAGPGPAPAPVATPAQAPARAPARARAKP
ncbi:MAG: iron(III) transport system ATP-binding protein [Streptosporangiaceae bacterium]|nr:iron(III) transport system ATP-binding protein [Streptosporangiaceae bacterium]